MSAIAIAEGDRLQTLHTAQVSSLRVERSATPYSSHLLPSLPWLEELLCDRRGQRSLPTPLAKHNIDHQPAGCDQARGYGAIERDASGHRCVSSASDFPHPERCLVSYVTGNRRRQLEVGRHESMAEFTALLGMPVSVYLSCWDTLLSARLGVVVRDNTR